MTRLIDLTRKVQEGNDMESLTTILTLFEPKIRASLKQTSPQEQPDLYQELKLKVIEIVSRYDYKGAYGFWEFTHKLKEQYGLESTNKESPEKPYEKISS